MDHYLGGVRGTLALKLASAAASSKSEGQGQKVTFVLGNEACDLDSAVCAVVYAYFLSTREILGEKTIVPLLNVASDDVALKTEVVQCLLACGGLKAADVPCLEEIDFPAMKAKENVDFRLILVDHHNLFDETLEDRLAEIIDHRPISDQLPASCRDQAENSGCCRVNIKRTASCATLVMKRIWEINPDFRDAEALKLIRFAILADTNNFSSNQLNTTQDDVDVIDRIDLLLGLDGDLLSRKVDYQLVLHAKRDISSLSVSQCLRKDLKFIRLEGGIGLAMSSVMASALTFVQRENFEQEAASFLERNNCQSLVIMGFVISFPEEDGGREKMERDMAVFPCGGGDDENAAPSAACITEHLPQKAQLELGPINCASTPSSVKVFKQGNLGYSRKSILPLIKDILSSNL